MNILGQNHVIGYLTEGLKHLRLSPSLIFVGPEGVGKKTIALELAKCFSCKTSKPKGGNNALPCCGECGDCHKVSANIHPDLFLLSRDLQAALLKEKPEQQTAVKIESVRHADKFVHLKPLEGSRRIVIIEEANKLTLDAANALLKLLEEPPNNAQFVLLTLDEHSLPSTVQSRCAILRFRGLPSPVIAEWLEKEHAVPHDKALEIAEKSGGSFSKALALNEETTESLDLTDYNLEEFFGLLAEPRWRSSGRKQTEKAITHLIETKRKKLAEGDLAQSDHLQTLLEARAQIDRHAPPRLVLENLFVKLTRPF